MALGKRGKQKQENMFVATASLAKSPGHPFYERLNQLLSEADFDGFAEAECAPYYAESGRGGPCGPPPPTPPYVRFRIRRFKTASDGVDVAERGLRVQAE